METRDKWLYEPTLSNESMIYCLNKWRMFKNYGSSLSRLYYFPRFFLN